MVAGAATGLAGALGILAIIGARSSFSTRGKPPPFAGNIQDYKPWPEPKTHGTLEFEALDGTTRPLAHWQGKVVLLNFWATWCAPCIEEMPALERLHRKLGGADFSVVAASIDRQGRSAVAPFVAKLGLNDLPIVLDAKGTAARAVGARGLPTSLIFDREGRERGRLEGEAKWDSPAAEKLIAFYIAENS